MADDSGIPTPSELTTLWRSRYQEFEFTRTRVLECRRWLSMKVDPEVPKDFAEAARMAVKLPHSVTVPLHAVQILSSKRPRLRRDPMGKSVTARRKASELELWVNAMIEEIEDQRGAFWRPMMDMLFNQGCGAVLCFPSAAGWENYPEFADDNGVLPKFQRDKEGRDRSSPNASKPFRVNKSQSKQAYDDYTESWKARNVPITIRCIGVDQSLPILGPGHRLDGLIVRSQYSQEDLEARGYRWRFDDGGHVGVGFDPDYQEKRGLYPKFTLYELWRPGEVVYYVGQGVQSGAEVASESVTFAYRQGNDGNDRLARVDLAGDFGIDRLPGTWVWGCNFASETDPDLRAVPFLWPFLSVFAGANNLATAELAHTWQHAFGGWFVPANADVPPELMIEKGRPRKLTIEPMKAQYVAGNPVPAVHPGTGKDVNELMTLMLGAVHDEGPSGAAAGGPGATSGHDRTLIRGMLEDAYTDVLNGGLEAYEFVGEMATEIADKLADKYSTPIPVYTAVQATGQRGKVRTTLELTQDMCDGVYDLDAEYPPEEGENLPYAQMLMEWSIQERIPLRQALEKGLADESPDETMIEILTERLLFRTPQGQQYIMQIAASELGDKKMKELFQAVQTGQAMPDGTPTAAVPPQPLPGQVQAPIPGQGALTGTAAPNPVQSAVGGIVAGGIGAGPMRQDAMATMTSPPVRPGTPA